jgi:HTH-type transcriptional regulator/antitoxin HipB
MAVKNVESYTLGSIILNLRKTSGLTRNELAALAGVGKTTIFDIENDKRTVQLNNVLKVAKVLNISIKLRSPFDEEWQLDF